MTSDVTPTGQAGSTSHLDAEATSERRATFAILVDNAPGVLHRVVGLFAARGYNIESLTVAETDHAEHRSRITVVTRGDEATLAQVGAQLGRIVQVRAIREVDGDPGWAERELALLKVRGEGAPRLEALRIADIFRARAIDTGPDSFVFELTGQPAKIDRFEALMRPLGLVEVSRTGSLAMARGPDRA